MTAIKNAGTRKSSTETKKPASKRRPTSKPEIECASAPIIVQKVDAAKPPKSHKTLTLGAEPQVSSGERCNIRDVLEASESAQRNGFETMVGITSELRDSEVLLAGDVLRKLQRAFGDDER